MSNDGDVVARGSAQDTAVSSLFFHIGDHGAFWNRAKGQNIAYSESRILTGVDELTSVHAFVGNEGFGMKFESIWVSKLDLGQWCTPSGVMDYLLYDTTDVAMTLCVVKRSKLRWRLVETSMSS